MENMTYGENITIEQAKALYFDADALLIAPRTVYRMDNRGRRFYFTLDADNKPRFYLSVTTFINLSLPTPVQLIDWIAENGRDKANDLRDEAAAYGTLLHCEIASMLIQKSYNLDGVGALVAGYIKEQNLSPKCVRWVEGFKRDMLSFAQFAIETNLKPLAIEMMLADDTLGLGGAIDLVCEFDIEEKGFYGEVYKSGDRKGEPKETKQTRRVRAIVDVKSGKKGFYESHELQLRGYKKMWNNFFTETPVELVFNWSPKAWTGSTPTYTLKDQTDTPKSFKFDHLLAIAQIEAADREEVATVARGVISLANPTLDANIVTMTLNEIVVDSIKRMAEAEEPETLGKAFDLDRDVLDIEDDA